MGIFPSSLFHKNTLHVIGVFYSFAQQVHNVFKLPDKSLTFLTKYLLHDNTALESNKELKN